MKRESNAPIKIAIAAATFNSKITDRLLDLCSSHLMNNGLTSAGIDVFRVPGAYELPFASHQLAATGQYDAVIALGCIIKGETAHDQYIAQWCSVGIGLSSILTKTPVIFGILTPKNEKQALARAKKGPLDRGREAAEAALAMIRFERTSRG